MCTLVVAELRAPRASHRENGSTRESSMDRDRDDTFIKTSFSYRGVRVFPGTCKTHAQLIQQYKDRFEEQESETRLPVSFLHADI